MDFAAGILASVTSRLYSMLENALQVPLVRPMAANLTHSEVIHGLAAEDVQADPSHAVPLRCTYERSACGFIVNLTSLLIARRNQLPDILLARPPQFGYVSDP